MEKATAKFIVKPFREHSMTTGYCDWYNVRLNIQTKPGAEIQGLWVESGHFLVWSWAAAFNQSGDEVTREDSDAGDRETPGPAIFGPLNPHVSYSDYSQYYFMS